MSDKTLAKVDYIKPLEDKPYDEVVAEKESYHKEIKNKLISIVQEENVKDDPEILENYSKDESLETPRRPSFVVFPKDTQQVCELVKYANDIKSP